MTTNDKDESETSSPAMDMRETKFFYVGEEETEAKAKKQYKPVVNVANADSFQPVDTEFRVVELNERNRKVKVTPTPKNLTSKYYSHQFMMKILHSSNAYRRSRLEQHPNLDVWKHKKDSAPFSMRDLYHIIAIIYYMGNVKFLNMEDYWSMEELMPVHDVCIRYGMN